MDIDKNKLPTKILWVDLEMTGLDSAKDRILEVSVLITDFTFKELASYAAVIKQSDDVLNSMNEWATSQHAGNGLTERVRTEGRPEADIQRELVELIKQQFGSEPAVLGGNSIHSDRGFIRQWWPDVYALLHYRMLDVTAFKVVMQGKYGQEYQKADTHRASDDVRASIAELQYYLDYLHAHA
ncbi:MAG TPA: oligoribonuclease [Patescibacteria group bacterium]|nr:oligoribonuclease [Patescibacteria group bacterium]